MLDKIRAMREMTEKMAEMEKSVLDDVKKDRKQLRYDALCKIFDYLDDVADSLNRETVCVKLKDKQLFPFENFIYIRFNNTYATDKKYGTYTYSEEKLKWHITGCGYKDNTHRYQFINRGDIDELCINGKWINGYIELVENWQDVKSQIEAGLTKYYRDKMETIRKNTQANIEAYEKAANFNI